VTTRERTHERGVGDHLCRGRGAADRDGLPDAVLPGRETDADRRAIRIEANALRETHGAARAIVLARETSHACGGAVRDPLSAPERHARLEAPDESGLVAVGPRREDAAAFPRPRGTSRWK